MRAVVPTVTSQGPRPDTITGGRRNSSIWIQTIAATRLSLREVLQGAGVHSLNTGL